MASDAGKEGECSQDINIEGSLIDDGATSSRLLLPVKISEGLTRCTKPHLVAIRSETRFTHLYKGPLYCKHFERLQKHLEISTELRLTQECLKRYVAAVNFTKKLETNAEHEISRLDGIRRHELSKNSRLALEYYHKLCKEAKLHLNHWEYLVCKAQQHARCFGQIVAVLHRIQKFHQGFLLLKRQILFWLNKIALAGLRVLANASFKQLSSTVDLQNFLQGIEEFNHMLSTYSEQSDHLCSAYCTREEDRCVAAFSNDRPQSLKIVEILAMVCVERVKLLAKLTHEHFTYEAKAIELQDFLSTTRFSWTFDGHFSSNDLLKCTENVRYAKLQSVIKKFGNKEDEFIKQLLNTASVCAFLHHENEIKRRSTEILCHRHLNTYEYTSSQSNCPTCQQSNSSVKAITYGSEFDVEFCDLSEAPQPSDEAVNLDRRALFMESRQTKLKFQLCSIYKDDLWTMVAGEFQSFLRSLRWRYSMDTPLGPVCCWSTAVLMGITQHLGNLALTGPFPEAGAQSVQVVSHSLYLNSVLASYDGLHCLLLAVGQQDKCKSAKIIDGVPSTKTTSLMVQACSIFQHFFSTASHWKEYKPAEATLTGGTCPTLPVRIEEIFNRFGTFLNYCIYWFTTNVKHFLASWTLSPFLVLSQYELGILMKSINTTLQLMEHWHCKMGVGSNHSTMVKQHWDQMERKAAHLQVIEVESWDNFKQKFISIASEFWQEMMPKGRIWKRSRNSGSVPACEPNSYVEHAIVQVLQPVIEGVSQLPVGFQNCILLQAVEIMMDTWSSHILKEEIKFSVIGAYQLQVDFNYVKLWLTSEACSLDISVQSDLAILDVFQQLNEAVHLLMVQPKKKKRIIENGFEPELESNTSAISGSSVLSTASSYDGDLDLLNNQLIPNKEQWLNLRLRKGKPRMPLVIPACLRAAKQS